MFDHARQMQQAEKILIDLIHDLTPGEFSCEEWLAADGAALRARERVAVKQLLRQAVGIIRTGTLETAPATEVAP